jgi:hypothetical protein
MYRRTFCPGRRNVAARCLQLVSMPWNVHLVMDITFLRPADFVHDEWAVVYVGSADDVALLHLVRVDLLVSGRLHPRR